MKNRRETEKKLIDSVGIIFARDGYSGLTLRGIAREAGVNKELIYRYFGTVSGLVETYVKRKDFWLQSNAKFKKAIKKEELDHIDLESEITKIIQNQFRYFLKSEEMQHIILAEITEKNPLLDAIGHTREEMGNEIFNLTSDNFKNSEKDIRSLCALLVSGVYYLVLHAKHNTSTVCGIDIKNKDERKRINTTIAQVMSWAFE